jgi:hypothetical protein
MWIKSLEHTPYLWRTNHASQGKETWHTDQCSSHEIEWLGSGSDDREWCQGGEFSRKRLSSSPRTLGSGSLSRTTEECCRENKCLQRPLRPRNFFTCASWGGGFLLPLALFRTLGSESDDRGFCQGDEFSRRRLSSSPRYFFALWGSRKRLSSSPRCLFALWEVRVWVGRRQASAVEEVSACNTTRVGWLQRDEFQTDINWFL